MASDRCYHPLTKDDVGTIRDLAVPELERFLTMRGGKYAVYRDRLLGMCLCQGAARHYLDGETGVKDIDVFFFFEEHPERKIPHARNLRKSLDADAGGCGRRRFDLMKKQIPARHIVPGDPLASIRDYLRTSGNRTPRLLAEQAVVGLHPEDLFGVVVWPPDAPPAHSTIAIETDGTAENGGGRGTDHVLTPRRIHLRSSHPACHESLESLAAKVLETGSEPVELAPAEMDRVTRLDPDCEEVTVKEEGVSFADERVRVEYLAACMASTLASRWSDRKAVLEAFEEMSHRMSRLGIR